LQVDQLGHSAQFLDACADFKADRMIGALFVKVRQSIVKIQPSVPKVLRRAAQVMVLHERNSIRQNARIHADPGIKSPQGHLCIEMVYYY
jgi:hypothetical protein